MVFVGFVSHWRVVAVFADAPNTSETFDKRVAQTQRVIECTNSELHATPKTISVDIRVVVVDAAVVAKVRDDVVDESRVCVACG